MMRALKWTVFEVVAWTAAAGIITALAISAAFYPTGAAAVVTWAASTGAAAAAGWVALLGVSSFSSTYLLNWAWQLEPAGPVDMVNMSFFVAAMLVFQMAVLQAASAPVVTRTTDFPCLFPCLAASLLWAESPLPAQVLRNVTLAAAAARVLAPTRTRGGAQEVSNGWAIAGVVVIVAAASVLIYSRLTSPRPAA